MTVQKKYTGENILKWRRRE